MTAPLPPFDSLHGYLPPGWHPADTQAFRRRCVDEIHPLVDADADPHRAAMFEGYLKLYEALRLLGIPAEQWIGGSYASTKSHPTDIDIVSFCDAHAYEALPAELKAMIRRYLSGSDTAKHCYCDSYFVPKWPPDHPCNPDYLRMFAYWKKLLGHDQRAVPKGLIGVNITPPATLDEDELPA